ncbi:hypothetical protein GCM10020221_13070 [Streptomyces thioluteus]|uniref:Uncharacterized protein n=1 Tax=Streptomyces thioluteus TaxID=66431 RepID=A0ABN3WMA9_STRTU
MGAPEVVRERRRGAGDAELAVESVRHKGSRTVPVEPVVQREIVALTLPDLARVPAVARMLDHLTAAARR